MPVNDPTRKRSHCPVKHQLTGRGGSSPLPRHWQCSSPSLSTAPQGSGVLLPREASPIREGVPQCHQAPPRRDGILTCLSRHQLVGKGSPHPTIKESHGPRKHPLARVGCLCLPEHHPTRKGSHYPLQLTGTSRSSARGSAKPCPWGGTAPCTATSRGGPPCWPAALWETPWGLWWAPSGPGAPIVPLRCPGLR